MVESSTNRRDKMQNTLSRLIDFQYLGQRPVNHPQRGGGVSFLCRIEIETAPVLQLAPGYDYSN